MRSHDFFRDYIYESVLPELMAVKGWSKSSQKFEYNSEDYVIQEDKWIRSVAYPRKAKPSSQEAHKEFLKIASVDLDKQSGMISLSVSHFSPLVARDWSILLIESINSSLRDADIKEAERSIQFLEKQSLKTRVVSLDTVFAQLVEEKMKTIMLANVSEVCLPNHRGSSRA